MSKIIEWMNGWLTARKLFAMYVLVNLVPSLFLVYTEPLNVPGKVILLLFPLGIYLILFSVVKKTGLIQLLCIPLLVIHAFQLVVFYLFGEDVIATDMFLNVVSTSPAEAGELLNSLWPAIIGVCVLYIPTILAAAKQAKDRLYLSFRVRVYTISVGLVLLVSSFVLSLFAQNINTGRFTLYKDIYPLDVFYNLKLAVHKWNKTQDYPKTSEGFRFDAHKDTLSNGLREVYVLVIGETSRAENWSLYGYERDTNPELSARPDLIHFDDVLTQSNTTHKSVTIMLSAAAAEDYDVIYAQKSIIDAFKEVHFKTVFLSNQADNGMLTQYFAESADFYRNIRSTGEGLKQTENNLDDALLPLLEHAIDSVKGNLFVVLHTYGSHFNYNERYPKEFSVFTPDDITEVRRKDRQKMWNAYDNTILFTDHLLAQVIGILDQKELCASMLYISDHGEDLMDDTRNRFLHASPNPTFYQLRVPLLLWFSPGYWAEFPTKAQAACDNTKKPVASNAVFHTLLDIASVHTKYLDTDRSLVNPLFKVQKRMYLDDHDQPIFFYDANLKKEDKAMIEKRNIYH